MGVQDIRNGTAFLLDGVPWIGLKYEHIKMGRGSATIKIKMKSLVTGATVEKSFINSAKVEEITLVKKPMQYLYKDGESFVFMDARDYEQVSLEKAVVDDNEPYLKEGVQVNILFWEEKPLWIELPPKMEFTIVETDPGVKGNSVASMFKTAKLDNGLDTRVPLFIEEGERVIIDTTDGSYVERAK